MNEAIQSALALLKRAFGPPEYIVAFESEVSAGEMKRFLEAVGKGVTYSQYMNVRASAGASAWAGMLPYTGERGRLRLMRHAPRIHVNLDNFNLQRIEGRSPRSTTPDEMGGYAYHELALIRDTPELAAKTVFYRNGKVSRSPFLFSE